MSDSEYYHGVYDPVTQSVIKVPFTEEEIIQRKLEEKNLEEKSIQDEWKKLRIKRNQLLLGCDWIELPSANITQEEKDAWLVYRTQLRDITSTITSPFDVVWPTPPKEILYGFMMPNNINT